MKIAQLVLLLSLFSVANTSANQYEISSSQEGSLSVELFKVLDFIESQQRAGGSLAGMRRNVGRLPISRGRSGEKTSLVLGADNQVVNCVREPGMGFGRNYEYSCAISLNANSVMNSPQQGEALVLDATNANGLLSMVLMDTLNQESPMVNARKTQYGVELVGNDGILACDFEMMQGMNQETKAPAMYSSSNCYLR